MDVFLVILKRHVIVAMVTVLPVDVGGNYNRGVVC